MKYPNPWEADGSITVSSDKQRDHDRSYALHLHIYRPGTKDHGRRITARPSYAQLLELQQQINHHLGLE